MARTHGIAATYRDRDYACRCEDCTAANTALQNHENLARWEAMIAGDVNPPHGKASTYVNYMCRCKPCTKANTEAVKAYRARRKAEQA